MIKLNKILLILCLFTFLIPLAPAEMPTPFITVWNGSLMNNDLNWTNITQSGTAQGQMLFWDDTNSRWTYTETSELVWDDTNKRLGIGTDSPGAPTHIKKQSATDVELLRLDAWSSGTGDSPEAELQFWGNPTNYPGSTTFNTGKMYSVFDGTNYASCRTTFATPTGVGTWTDVMSLKDGKMGVGNTDPNSLLHIGETRLDTNGHIGTSDATPDANIPIYSRVVSDSDATVLKLQTYPETASNYQETGVEFWAATTGGINSFNAAKITGAFDANNYAGGRFTISSPTGAGAWTDVLNVKDGKVGILDNNPPYPLSVEGKISADQLSLGSESATSIPLYIQGNYNPLMTMASAPSGITNINMQGTNIGLVWYPTDGHNMWRFFTWGGTFGIRDNTAGNTVILIEEDATEHSIYVDDSGHVGLFTNTPAYPLEVKTNVSGISIWSEGNVSATGYNTRTSIYDKTKGSALQYIKDADSYKTAGEIDHTKFYGYIGTTTATDYNRPETTKRCEDYPVNEEEEYQEEECTYKYDSKSELYIKDCQQVTKTRIKQNCHLEDSCTYEQTATLNKYNQTCKKIEVCEQILEERCEDIITYPYTKEVPQISLTDEIDVLRQALFELEQENNQIKAALCSLDSTLPLCKQQLGSFESQSQNQQDPSLIEEVCAKDDSYPFCEGVNL